MTTKQQYVLIDGAWQPTGGPPGPAGPPASVGSVTLWADLPVYTSVPLGTRVHVTSGLGVLYALRGPTGWVVDENSDTGWQNITPLVPAASAGMRRVGSQVHSRYWLTPAASPGGIPSVYVYQPGWRIAAPYPTIPSGRLYENSVVWASFAVDGVSLAMVWTAGIDMTGGSVFSTWSHVTDDPWPTTAARAQELPA